ncbi:erythroferrone isoform X2 [Dunckerocampus dactyliophorus]|uniref:erythroferrone isoform X2 n=1 Tax=Dunckerocampus dactyliophorus TaxID=161453 RepID=UPI002405E9E4|nr:erythroferrone isoform X2 [Dunckerocampus dactyliophorus]
MQQRGCVSSLFIILAHWRPHPPYLPLCGNRRSRDFLPSMWLLLGIMMMLMSGSQEVVVQNEEFQDVSPASSWLMFLKNSNNEASSRTSKVTTRKHQGPPGPQGLLQPGQRHLKLADVTSKACVRCEGPPRVSASFLGRLLQAVSVRRRSLLEAIRFQRGQSFNGSDGRFVAPFAAFYQLSANLLLQSGDRVHMRPRDSVRAAICLDSLCQSNLSIESVMGMTSVGGAFRIFLTGTFFLQAGEYASVFVDNGTGSAISILTDSFFSGILLGA